MTSIGVTGHPLNGFVAVAVAEALMRKLVAKGVLSEDELAAVLNEAADVLGKQAAANAKSASQVIRNSLPPE